MKLFLWIAAVVLLHGMRERPDSNEGMVRIPAGEFTMGSADEHGRPDEYPQHKVKVDAFWMDATEVTNAQFRKFVDATGYVTTAEQKPDWNELKKQLPPNTPKPPDDLLVPASLVFHSDEHHTSPGEWWQWTKGANWRHPQGEASNIDGKDNYPVTHISWYDANAYAKWAGKRLPTEAEWEWAARGASGSTSKVVGNIWEGEFPHHNSMEDKYERTAPVKSFQSNNFGLFDMAGNVWEWCSDWYDAGYYERVKDRLSENPVGSDKSFDPEEPTVQKKVIRGGSFMCHDSYCSGYRPSARMKVSPDTGLEHTGFRCVRGEK